MQWKAAAYARDTMVYGIIRIDLGKPYFTLYRSYVCSARHLIARLVYNFLLSSLQVLMLLVCSQTCQQKDEIISVFIKHQINYLTLLSIFY